MLKQLVKHIATLLFILLPLQTLGWLVLPVVLLFVPKEQETLPKYFRWFDNAEIPLGLGSKDDGLAGPKYYREPQLAFYSKYLGDTVALYLVRYIWLGWRNPINYFQYKVMGVKMSSGVAVSYTVLPNSKVDYGVGSNDGQHAGLHYLNLSYKSAAEDGVYTDKNAFEIYYVYKWPDMITKIFKQKKCFRARIGWKIGEPWSNINKGPVQWVLTITPFKKYDGE